MASWALTVGACVRAPSTAEVQTSWPPPAHRPRQAGLSQRPFLRGSEFYHLPTAAWAKITFEQNSWESIANGTLSLGMPKDILNT